MFFKKNKESILILDRIQLGLESVSKEEAIIKVGESLFKTGCVEESYIAGMLERELVATTYIGSSVAIPHGTNAYKKYVVKTGISVQQYPEGIDFGNGNIAYLVIGIAAKGDEHMDILMQIADAVSDPEVLKQLIHETNPIKILNTFTAKG